MSKKLSQLKGRQKQHLASLARNKTFLDSLGNREISEKEFFETRCRLEKLSSLLEAFEKVQNEIELITDFQDEDNLRLEFENTYFGLHAGMQEIIDKHVKGGFESIGFSQQTAQKQVYAQQIQFPIMNLPNFDGEYHKWPEFRDTFLSLIDNNVALSKVQKFHHLRSCLTPDVLDTIKSIPVSNDNYSLAWNQLCETYERKHLIANQHVNSILNFPKLIKESSKDLRSLRNCVRNNLEALRNLNIEVDGWDLLLIPLITEKLDLNTRKEWEKFSVRKRDVNLHDLLNIINDRYEYLERLEINKPLSSKTLQEKTHLKPISKFSSAIHFQKVDLKCTICEGGHPAFKCDSLLKLAVRERIKRVKEKGLCLNCLKSSHVSNKCFSSKCKKCRKSHNTLLHLETEKESTDSNQNQETVVTATTQSCPVKKSILPNLTLLPTAIVWVADKNNEWIQCRALLDSGAMSCFISKHLCERLRLPLKTINCSIRGVGKAFQKIQHQTEIVLSPSKRNGSLFKTSCLIINKITSNIPLISFDQGQLAIPDTIQLADPNFSVTSPIDLLLGSTIFWELLEDGRVSIPNTGLTLQNTKLGWILGGQISKQTKGHPKPKHSITCTSVVQEPLDNIMRNYWELEEINPKIRLSPDDQYCEDLFQKTTIRGPDGRFIIRIPFKQNLNQLGDSRDMALKRFYILERKLIKNPDLYNSYKKIMDEYKSLEHMKEIDENSTPDIKGFYIPHHAVLKTDSLTTKTRIVFDASMKSTSGLSLNDVQFVGPSIQNEIFVTLLNFRLHKYIICSDITKMYRMIWLDNDHKSFHRIFWRDNPDDCVKVYELQTVTFGTASAPFLAIRCLNQLAMENELLHPEAAKIIKNNFYVDDLVFGAESIPDLIDLQHDIFSILSSAGFYLRKWLCNDESVYEHLQLSPDLECNTLQFGDTENKTLGISWDAKRDKICYSKSSISRIDHVTKRTVLSHLLKIFDPLGLVNPVLIVGKLLMRNLWQRQLAWDELLPQDLANQWSSFQKEIEQINTLNINRRVLVDNYCKENIELHGFCDASERAYGACVFIRSQNQQGKFHTHLLCSKTKVAPLKTISLPRLELCGALLLARLINKVSIKIEIKFSAIHCWTDSTIVLAWINGEPSRWKTFIANRVGEIQQLTSVKDWHHVFTTENPADVLSRGTTVKKLSNHQLWWSGPDWLKNRSLPIEKDIPVTDEIPEQRVLIHTVISNGFDIFEKFSSFKRLLRVTAYCHRFRKNCATSFERRTLGDLTVDELETSKRCLLHLMQIQSFGTDYHDLESERPLHTKSRLLSLNPFIGDDKLIRVGGRLEKSNLNYESKHPIILSPHHKFTKLLIQYVHNENFHCGPTTLLSILRQNYWPLDARNVIRGITRKCRVCLLAKPKGCSYLMGQLPTSRITQSFPFQIVGVDYAGPIFIKDRVTRNYKVIKSYICLFICFSTKAIHLDCVLDLSTASFLSCLKRFISRRGKPTDIYSDNGTNFTGANSEIKRFYKQMHNGSDKINEFLAHQMIKWHFIPARSPNFGGLWESGIKLVKSYLTKVMKNTKFHFEELQTVLCQIEAVVNSRPITPLTSDPADLTPLTPAHFLIGRPLTHSPEISNPSIIPASRLKHFNHFQNLLSHFWNRWSKEYLHQLQVRSKWHQRSSVSPSVRVGQVVLLKEATQPFQWPLGLITELHPGTDGITRVVSVRVRNSVVKRGLNKICILPDMV